MVTYRVIEEKFNDGELGEYIAFGICAYETNGDKQEKVACVSDVFLNREVAEKLVDMCNELELEIIHLMDVIEDAIC